MNLTPEECGAFVHVGWQKGLEMVAERQAAAALKELTMPAEVNPDAIARAQTAYAIWKKEIPSIFERLAEHLSSQTPSTAGVK